MLRTLRLLEGKPERRTYETTTHKTRAHQVRHAGTRDSRGRGRRTLLPRVSTGEECPCRRRGVSHPHPVHPLHASPTCSSSQTGGVFFHNPLFTPASVGSQQREVLYRR